MIEPDWALPLNRSELIAQVGRMNAKLLELAGSCAQCNGTGMDTDYFDEHNALIPEGDPRRAHGRAVTRPCEDCDDIRELCL